MWRRQKLCKGQWNKPKLVQIFSPTDSMLSSLRYSMKKKSRALVRAKSIQVLPNVFLQVRSWAGWRTKCIVLLHHGQILIYSLLISTYLSKNEPSIFWSKSTDPTVVIKWWLLSCPACFLYLIPVIRLQVRGFIFSFCT